MKTLDRRGFLGRLSVSAVALALPVPVVELTAPAAKQAVADALTRVLWQKRMAIDAISGRYVKRFLEIERLRPDVS